MFWFCIFWSFTHSNWERCGVQGWAHANAGLIKEIFALWELQQWIEWLTVVWLHHDSQEAGFWLGFYLFQTTRYWTFPSTLNICNSVFFWQKHGAWLKEAGEKTLVFTFFRLIRVQIPSTQGPQKFPWWFTVTPLQFDAEVEFQFAISDAWLGPRRHYLHRTKYGQVLKPTWRKKRVCVIFLCFLGGLELKETSKVCVTFVHCFRAKLSPYWEVVYYVLYSSTCKLLHKIL